MKRKFDEDEIFDDELDETQEIQNEDELLLDETLTDDEELTQEDIPIIDPDEIEEDDGDVMFKYNTNNHKIEGKHSLKRDTIFKGKLDSESLTGPEEYLQLPEEININDGLPIEVGTNYEFESKYHEEYVNRQNLSKDVHEMLSNKTDLDFSCNRRKPNRQAFNDYYKMLLDNLGMRYTKSEIFVELSYYFTDNIFNMFKLLDKEYATQIIIELKQSGYLDNLNNINFV